MAHTPSDLKLKIISMNVRGLRNLKKRSLFYIFKQNKYEIICLQENNFIDHDKNIIEKEWGSNFHLTEVTSHSKGLLKLFSSPLKSENIKIALKGDTYLVSTVSIDNTNLAVEILWSLH